MRKLIKKEEKRMTFFSYIFRKMLFNNLRFHLPVLLPSSSNSMTIFYSIYLIFSCQLIPLASSSSYNLVRNLTESIENYLCQTYIQTCFFRERYHPSPSNQAQIDKCKSLLILHSCLYHDFDTKRICDQKVLKQTRLSLDKQIPEDCFTSSVYKTFYAKHLRSIAPSRTIFKRSIFILFSLFISFIIKI